jgi:hypothetical protein
MGSMRSEGTPCKADQNCALVMASADRVGVLSQSMGVMECDACGSTSMVATGSVRECG